MPTFQVAQLNKKFAGMTQANMIGSKGSVLPISDALAPQIFTSTFMASMSGDFLFKVGAGEINANQHTRILTQWAMDNGRSVVDVTDEFINLLKGLGYSPEGFRKIIAGIMGVNDKPVGRNRIPAVTPSYVLMLVRKAAGGAPEVMLHMLTDYVCHMLRPMGWIIQDAPYVYRMKRNAVFPDYDALVDIMTAHEVSNVLQKLADADLSIIKNTAEKNNAVQPAHIATQMSNALVMAYDRARGTYDPEAIVRSTLTVLARVWSPYTPQALEPKPRVANSSVVNDFRSNLALFLAYQDMVARKGVDPQIDFDDESMANVVLPLFSEAMASVSPFKRRIMDDAVSFYGKASSRDHMGQPDHMVIYEDWDYATEVTAFVPVKQTANGAQRYLDLQPAVSSAMSSAMKPIRNMVNVQKLVEDRISTYDMIPSGQKGMTGQAQLVLGFPSLVERQIAHHIKSGVLESFIQTGKVPMDGETPEISEEMAHSLQFDYMASVVHLAVAKTKQVSITSTDRKDSLYLTYTLDTPLKKPIGATAIYHSRVTTSEPIEALCYVDDFRPTRSLQLEELPLADYKDAVHIWDWFGSSNPLSFNTSYMAELRNKLYTATVDEHEMLGLGLRRKNISFLTPTVATAIARMWIDWHVEETAFIKKQIKGTKDDIVVEAFEGRKIRNAITLATSLSQIGATGSGANAARFAEQRIVDQMYDAGMVDDYADLHVGAQKQRLRIWAGLSSMEMLGLIGRNDAQVILDYLKETSALSLIVGTGSGTREE